MGEKLTKRVTLSLLTQHQYKKNEIGLRMALLYCGSIISNAFGALMASGILSGMDGALGHAAWRYFSFPSPPSSPHPLPKT